MLPRTLFVVAFLAVSCLALVQAQDVGELQCGGEKLPRLNLQKDLSWSDKEAAGNGAISGIRFWTARNVENVLVYGSMQVKYGDEYADQHPDPDDVKDFTWSANYEYEFEADERLTKVVAYTKDNVLIGIVLHTNKGVHGTPPEEGRATTMNFGHEIIYFSGSYDRSRSSLHNNAVYWDACTESTRKNALEETISSANKNFAVREAFEQAERAHISWGSPAPKSVTYVAKCAALCNEDKNCVGFDFNYGYIGANRTGPYQGVACWLHDESKNSCEDTVGPYMEVDFFCKIIF